MSCGGKVAFVEGSNGGGGEGGASFDCQQASFDLDVPVSICGSTAGPATSCTIQGQLPDGRSLRQTCTGTASPTCELFVDALKVCTCPAKLVDFASTCPNGVATCSLWEFNAATATVCF